MADRLFHCPLCAADVDAVMYHTGYCDPCAEKSDTLLAKRDEMLARKRSAVK